MSMVSISCSCGAVRGSVSGVGSRWGRRIVCLCRDCQAFARFLQRSAEILDDNGGTDIFQVTPSQITLDRGQENLACMKLSPKGILRWSTSCCNTPVGNMLASFKVPFVGIPHLFMDHAADGKTRDAALGPVSYRIHGRDGYGQLSADTHDKAPFKLIPLTLGRLIIERLRGHHLPTPFFDTSNGEPVSTPRVLSLSERQALTAGAI